MSLKKLIIFLFKKDLILFNSLIKENISTLSHRKLFKNSKIKIIGWIPDLQHKVLKKFLKPWKYSHPQGAQRWVKNVSK